MKSHILILALMFVSFDVSAKSNETENRSCKVLLVDFEKVEGANYAADVALLTKALQNKNLSVTSDPTEAEFFIRNVNLSGQNSFAKRNVITDKVEVTRGEFTTEWNLSSVKYNQRNYALLRPLKNQPSREGNYLSTVEGMKTCEYYRNAAEDSKSPNQLMRSASEPEMLTANGVYNFSYTLKKSIQLPKSYDVAVAVRTGGKTTCQLFMKDPVNNLKTAEVGSPLKVVSTYRGSYLVHSNGDLIVSLLGPQGLKASIQCAPSREGTEWSASVYEALSLFSDVFAYQPAGQTFVLKQDLGHGFSKEVSQKTSCTMGRSDFESPSPAAGTVLSNMRLVGSAYLLSGNGFTVEIRCQKLNWSNYVNTVLPPQQVLKGFEDVIQKCDIPEPLQVSGFFLGIYWNRHLVLLCRCPNRSDLKT